MIFLRTKAFLCFCMLFGNCLFANAQQNFPTNGVVDYRTGTYLLDNGTITTDGETSSFVGDVLIREGKIVNVSAEIKAKDAVVIDLTGKYLYPSFIELFAQYGIENLKPSAEFAQQFVSDKPGAYNWNEAIRSEFRAHESFVVSKKDAESYRNAGFGAVLTHRMDGIARGTGTLVAVADLNEHEVILKKEASNHLSLSKGSSSQNYPSSQMGAIALLKQTYLDAKWYAKNPQDVDLTLQGWNDVQELPEFMDPKSLLGIFRVDKIGDEFGKQYIIKGSGSEYQKIKAIKSTNAFIVVPVNYPPAYDTEDPWDAEYVSLAKMKHWELAPYNLKMMEEERIPFSITSDGLKDKADFLKNIKIAVEKGLSEKAALRALTSNPARKLGVEKQVGTIAPGKLANILVTDKPVFNKESKILQNWVKGIAYQINPFNIESIDGEYSFQIGKTKYNATLTKSDTKPTLTFHLNDTTDITANCAIDDNQITISFAIPDDYKQSGYTTLSGWRNGSDLKGKGRLSNGSKITWSAGKTGGLVEKEKSEGDEETEKDKKETDEIGDVIYPFTSYGYKVKPKAERVLFKNGTIWTNEKKGVLKNVDLLIEDGKIVKVGKDLSDKNAKIVDATNKHITAGIIDEHSHIAIGGGVNEWAQASSAEVSIEDVINSEDVNIYRQLAGGVVASQLLHGSANPIGGQSALIKLRWGSLPEEMKIKGADGFIKFALGENVKQSNWGDDNRNRFPQTRMGVEQVFMDHFTRAQEYAKNTDENKRRDIELETLVKILESKRFITCHSYVQSEINMLMKVAENFDFRINTFTHILEGYKIADKMKEHGVGASTFSDWWAYKYEVVDAIPYNAAILNQMGIITAINSDDAEMGRRLNQEAAKTIKYGGVSEEDALKMVTLNPAKLLHLDDKMGSVKAGKDADIVLWSDHPLSIYAKAEQTYVDGIKYFDLEEDKEMRLWIQKERARLIQKMLVEKKGGATAIKPTPTEEHNYHCDDVEHWGQDQKK